MHIGQIPSEIIKVILSKAAELEEPCLDSWKCKLSLLAVCHNWRQLAIPAVFSHGFATNTSTDLVDNTIQLAVAAQATSYVRHINIKYCGMTRLVHYLQNVVSLIKTDITEWHSVQSLNIYLDADSYFSTPTNSEVAQVSAGIKSVLPNISILTFNGCQLPAAVALYSRLTDDYAMQLRRLTSPMPLETSAPMFSKQLKHLQLQFDDEAEIRIPKVHAETLHSLSLHCLSNDYDWTEFSVNTQNSAINFAQLESLHIAHYADYESEFGSKFLFPNLKHLHLQDTPKCCTVLANGMFPKNMESIYIHGSADAFSKLAKAEISHVHSLHLKLSQTQPDVEEFTSATNSLFSLIEVSGPCTLLIGSITEQLNFSKISWPNLTCLEMCRQTDASTLLHILSKLPKLQNLSSYRIRVDVDMEQIKVPQVCDTKELNSISTSLMYFSFGINSSSEPITAEIAFLKYLMLQAPSLQKIQAVRLSSKPLLEFIAEYKPVYLHLANVQIVG